MTVCRQRDAEASKVKIIENAMILFSKKGFDATTVDDIAAACGVNKALLYYYYKNKAGLYEAVMMHVLGAIYEEVVTAGSRCGDPLSELETFIKTYADYAEKQPYFPALMLRELSDSGAHLPEMMFSSMRRLFALLSAILERGEKEGLFHNVVPMVIHFMIVGTLNLLVTTAPLRVQAAQTDDSVDTCSDCRMSEIADYLFEKAKLMLEVN